MEGVHPDKWTEHDNYWTLFYWSRLAPTHLFSMLEAELNSLNSIHTSYQTLILSVTQLFKKEPSCNGVAVPNKCMRSLLPFLGEALS